MAVLKIPPARVSGLIKLRELEQESLHELMAALTEGPLKFRAEDLEAYLTGRIKTISETDIKEILGTLVSLSLSQTQLNLPVSEFAEGVCTAMQQSENTQLKLVGEQCDIFKQRLLGLLNIEALTFPLKASGVMADHDQVFLRARVLTDIRAIFGSDIEAPPKGSVIVHTLNITHLRNGEEDRFYVAMDSEDVESLIATLQRSLAKTASLRVVIEAAGVACLNPE